MKISRIYAAFLNDGEEEIMLQPFLSENDDMAAATVKNAIRADEGILAIALSERISLKWICDVDLDNETVINDPSSMFEIFNETYFRKYAQTVYADNKKKEANVAEALKND